MFSLNCNIKVFETDKDLNINGRVFQFSQVRDIKIKSNYKNFTDTAVLQMPKTIVESQLNNSLGIELARRLPIDLKPKSINEFFKQDHYIEIYLGYDGEYKPAFRGYIKTVKGDAPVEIHCEDFMYVLKKHKMVSTQTRENKKDIKNPISTNPSKTVSGDIEKMISDRLKELPFTPTFKLDIVDEKVGEFVIDRSLNIVQFLDVIRKRYKIYSFFKIEEKESVLLVTDNPMIYDQAELNTLIDRFQILSGDLPIPKVLLNRALSQLGITDIINFFKKGDLFIGEGQFRFHHNIIEDQLKVINLETKKVRVRCEKYFSNSNTPIFVELGDEGGELVETLKMHETEKELANTAIAYQKQEQEVKAELTDKASKRLALHKLKGVEGTFTTFGEPFIRPTDRVFLVNAEDEEKNGVFQVEEVERSYGLRGYRQVIGLGRLVSKQKTI